MEWQTPDFEEIRMDAEIGAYMPDERPSAPVVDDTAAE